MMAIMDKYYKQKSASLNSTPTFVQRKCACGGSAKLSGSCSSCENEKLTGLQTKLKIGAANDSYEHEADRVADQVMRASSPSSLTPTPIKISRYASTNTTTAGSSPASVERTLSSSGRPLDTPVRQDMEQRFGHDFSNVRIHTSASAARSASDIQARAYTAGNNIVFNRSEYAPQSNSGKYLLAHELAHTLQQSTSIGSSRLIQRRRCTSTDDPDDIVDTHTVSNNRIDSPGDDTDFEIRFKCDVRGFRSDIESASGTSLNLRTYPQSSSFPRNSYSRTWDGKKGYPNVGTYMVGDGNYRHRLSQVLYAYQYNSSTGASDNLYATDTDLVSPNVTVATRAGAFSNHRSNHYTTANVETVAKIVRSEMGIGNDQEQTAIAWAVRNQMISMNTRDATVAQNHFGDAHSQAATDDTRYIAQLVLSVDMSHDTSSGAIKWFSPRSMPSRGDSCSGFDCSGGTITVVDDAGTSHEKYAPGFHNDMTYVPVSGARDWYVRFYKL